MTDIIIPWRPTPARQKAFDYIIQRLTKYNLIIVDDQSEPFSRAGSKNLGASQSQSDVLFFLDADMLVPTQQIDQAIEAAKTQGIVVAFDKYKYLNKATTEKVLTNHINIDKAPSVYTVGWALGGAVAVNRSIFEGYDTDFIGWGMEDAALVQVAKQKGYPLKKIKGVGIHLWHPGHKRDQNVINNEALYRERYLTHKDSVL